MNTPENDETTTVAACPTLSGGLGAIGDRVKLTKDIFDDGADHHPPGYCARRGEIVIVRKVREGALAVSHDEVIDSAFVIYAGEFEAANEKVRGCANDERKTDVQTL